MSKEVDEWLKEKMKEIEEKTKIEIIDDPETILKHMSEAYLSGQLQPILDEYSDED